MHPLIPSWYINLHLQCESHPFPPSHDSPSEESIIESPQAENNKQKEDQEMKRKKRKEKERKEKEKLKQNHL